MTQLMQSVSVGPLLFVLCAGAVAAFTDIRSFRVPNYITFPLLLAGIVFHACISSGQGLSFGLAGAAVGFACLIIFYVLGGVGAGDVKLLAAMGAWIGPQAILALFMVAAILMGIYAAYLALRAGNLWQSVIKASLILQQGMAIVKHLGPEERVEEAVKGSERRKHLVPFAAMVFGGIAVLLALKFLIG
jgi:prepilin peptidase CpaA